MPGFVPAILRDASVGLLRADERVFSEMLDGWAAQMLARGLAVDTIKQRLRMLRRFQSFSNEYPWRWQASDVDEFFAERRLAERPLSLRTLRAESNAIEMFCSYASSPWYGWVELCERQFGDVPAQAVFEWNRPRHTADDAAPSGRRAFTRMELELLFNTMDDLVDAEHARGSKRWLSLLRDSIAFKVCYAYGLRRRELTMLEVEDFGPNPKTPQYRGFGAVQVRWAKGTAGSGPRHRTVLTAPKFEWVVDLLDFWVSKAGRGLFPTAARSSSLWPSERRARVTISTMSDSFAAARRLAGLPEGLGLHCLRHSYITHLLEADYDGLFVQTQVGHQNAHTTGLYTSVSSDYKQRMIQRMIAARLNGTKNEGDAHG